MRKSSRHSRCPVDVVSLVVSLVLAEAATRMVISRAVMLVVQVIMAPMLQRSVLANRIRCKPHYGSLTLVSSAAVRLLAGVGRLSGNLLLLAAVLVVLDLTAWMWLFCPVFDCDRVENRL